MAVDKNSRKVLEKEPLVSIVMPFFNREKYLPMAIDSILAQTYKNYELIAVDDGSTDSSYKVVQRYQKTLGDRLKIIQQQNSGPAHAKNTAIKNANGSLIAFLDSDDTWDENKLSVQIELFKRKSDIAFVYSAYVNTDDNGNSINVVYVDKKFQGHIHNLLWKQDNNICGGTIMVERNKLISSGLFDPDMKGAENLDLRIRLSKLGQVYCIEKPLYFYRRHGESLTADYNQMRQYHTSLINKHFIEPGQKGKLYHVVQSKLFYTDGMKLFSDGKMFESLIFFAKSVYWNPFNFKCYIQAIRCCLGQRVNEILSNLRTKFN